MKLLNKKTMITGLAMLGLVMSLSTDVTNASVLAAKSLITKEAAKKTALKDAGLTEKEVTYTGIELETDDGKKVYDIDFTAAGVKYSYDIDAKDGSVVSKEVKQKKKTKKKATKKSKFIGTAKAKSIALKHAKVSAKDATFELVKIDRENGVYIYEVDFHTSEKEYDYEINAKNGKVLKHESEYLDHDFDYDHGFDD